MNGKAVNLSGNYPPLGSTITPMNGKANSMNGKAVNLSGNYPPVGSTITPFESFLKALVGQLMLNKPQ